MDDARLPLSNDPKVPELYANEGDTKKEKEISQMQLIKPVIGLTKEQLEKYRNDPFWKPFRMFMFVLFWLIWVAMFTGAILIVVFSPKCSIKKDPQWWETKVNYQIFTPSFRDSDRDGVGDFKGIAEKLEEIRRIGVQSIWATPVITTDKDDFDPYEISDFEQIDERFGNVESLKHLVAEVHRLNMHFVMDFPISTTSRKHAWFIKASKGDENFKDFYLWKETVTGPSFGTLNDSVRSYIIYNERYPVLNLQNNNVRKAIAKAAKKYLDFGIDGFYIPIINQLGEIDQNTSNGQLAVTAIEYLKNEVEHYIANRKELKGKNFAIFTSLEAFNQLDGNGGDEKKNISVPAIKYIIDDSMKKLSKDNCVDGISYCVFSTLNRSLENFRNRKLPYVWQFTDYRVSRLSSRFNPQIGNLMTFMELTLPGAVEIYYGQEIGMRDADEKTGRFTGLMQWDYSEKTGFTEEKEMDLFFGRTSDYKTVNYQAQYESGRSPLKVFKILAKLRQRDNVLLSGDIKLMPLQKEILTYVRTDNAHKNEPVYIVGLNFGETENAYDLRSAMHGMHLSNAAVVATTAEFEAYSPRDILDINNTFTIPAFQGIMIKARQ